jgi:hypothetical protein
MIRLGDSQEKVPRCKPYYGSAAEPAVTTVSTARSILDRRQVHGSMPDSRIQLLLLVRLHRPGVSPPQLPMQAVVKPAGRAERNAASHPAGRLGAWAVTASELFKLVHLIGYSRRLRVSQAQVANQGGS